MSVEIPGCGKIPLISYSGTSMATPHVTGVVALTASINPLLSAQEIRNILQNTAIDLGPQGRDRFYGHGLLNAYGAVKLAQLELTNPPEKSRELLKEESARSAQKGIELLQAALKDPNPETFRNAIEIIRKAYFLDPNNLERKKLMFLVNRTLGFPTDAGALAGEIFAQTGRVPPSLASVSKGFVATSERIQAQIREEHVQKKIHGEFEDAVSVLVANGTNDYQTASNHIVNQMKDPNKLKFILDQFNVEKDEKKQRRLGALVGMYMSGEFAKKKPAEQEQDIAQLRELCQQLLRRAPTEQNARMLITLSHALKSRAGISKSQMVAYADAAIDGARDIAEEVIRRLWPEEAKAREGLLKDAKYKKELAGYDTVVKEMEKLGKFDEKLAGNVFDYHDMPFSIPPSLTRRLQSLWAKQPEEERRRLLSEPSDVLDLLSRAGVPEAQEALRDWVLVGKTGTFNYVKVQLRNPQFPVDQTLVEKIRSEVDSHVARINANSSDDEIKNLTRWIDLEKQLAARGMLSKERVVKLGIRLAHLSNERYPAWKRSRLSQFSMPSDEPLFNAAEELFDRTDLLEDKDGRELGNLLSAHLDAVHSGNKDKARLTADLIRSAFGSRYLPHRKNQVPPSAVATLFDKFRSGVELRDNDGIEDYAIQLAKAAKADPSVHASLYESLGSPKRNPFIVHEERTQELGSRTKDDGEERTVTTLSFTDSRTVSSLFAPALLENYDTANRLMQEQAHRFSVPKDDVVQVQLSALQLLTQWKIFHPEQVGELMSKLRAAIIAGYPNMRDKKIQHNAISSLLYFSPTQEEKRFINDQFIESFKAAREPKDVRNAYFDVQQSKTGETVAKLKAIDTRGWDQNKIYQLQGLIRELE